MILNFIRDWRRGYTDADYESAHRKFGRPGSGRPNGDIQYLTRAELRAVGYTDRRLDEVLRMQAPARFIRKGEDVPNAAL